MWNYAWKKRLSPLLGLSLAIWLVLRPAYWPFPAFGDLENVEFLQRMNQLVWVGVAVGSVFVADSVAIAIARRRNVGCQFSSFWPATAGILVAKTVIDFTFARRPLPEGSERFFACERWVDVTAILLLPFVYFLAKHIGPPSGWSIVLQPPTILEGEFDANATPEADAQLRR